MNYKLKNEGNKVMIVEKSTDQVVLTFDTREQAQQSLRNLNFGGGFDGWTPTFILKNIGFKQEKLAQSV